MWYEAYLGGLSSFDKSAFDFDGDGATDDVDREEKKHRIPLATNLSDDPLATLHGTGRNSNNLAAFNGIDGIDGRVESQSFPNHDKLAEHFDGAGDGEKAHGMVARDECDPFLGGKVQKQVSREKRKLKSDLTALVDAGCGAEREIVFDSQNGAILGCFFFSARVGMKDGPIGKHFTSIVA